MEPRYINDDDLDNDFIATPETHFEEQLLNATGRKKFLNREVKIAAQRLEKRIAEGKIPSQYAQELIRWAEKKNNLKITIRLIVLMRMIADKDRLAEWKGRNP